MTRIAILQLLFLLLFASCERTVDFVPYEPQVVVEGRIENGGKASVLLSTSVSFTEDFDKYELLSHAIRSAKVVLSDGEQEEILRLKTNYDRLPPFEYVSQEMKGEVGKNYSLTIYYKEQIISAETHIPTPVQIETLSFEKKQETDSVGQIIIGFQNTSDYDYQISTRMVGVEEVFRPSLFGNIDRTQYPADELLSIQVSKAPIIYPEADYSTAFPDSVAIEVKLATQTKASFDFWTSYQNEIINSQNPIYPSTTSLKSNINGGIGIWAGYGVEVKVLN
ncbi:MAG: DUF4249 family protein [Mangrovibacterium sp.]